MKRPVVFGLCVLAAMGLVFAGTATAGGVSLSEAIEKASKATGRTVISAQPLAGIYYMVTTVGGGKTQIAKVYMKSGDVKCGEPRDSKPLEAIFCKTLQVSCADAAKAAADMYKGEALALGFKTLGQAPCFEVIVKAQNGEKMKVDVSGLTGKVLSAQPAEDLGEPCE